MFRIVKRRRKMKVEKTVETMRKIVRAYDSFEAKKAGLKLKTEKVKNTTTNLLKGGNTMKFGTIIGSVIGALALIGAGAAAAYFFLKGGCGCDCDCGCCDCDDDLYDDFEEEPAEETTEVEEAPEEVVEG